MFRPLVFTVFNARFDPFLAAVLADWLGLCARLPQRDGHGLANPQLVPARTQRAAADRRAGTSLPDPVADQARQPRKGALQVGHCEHFIVTL